MILFKCSVCKERFPAFHPDCQPADVLQTTAHCSLAVHSWDRPPPPVTIATGCCQRCHASLQKVETDPLLKGVAAFSSANNMDFLDGMLDENAQDLSPLPPLLSPDESRLRSEYLHLFQNATVVESMLVALAHMQVDVCYLRGQGGRASGMTAFRKNIISFPQELEDLRQLRTFWTSLEVGDVVNVTMQPGDPPTRAVVRDLRGTEVLLQLSAGSGHQWVDLQCVAQRIRLPWKPSDLRHHLLIFRRHNSQRECYVEDLRVRRNLVRRILALLSLPGTWRTARGIEPLHLYYASCDILSSSQIDDLLPEDSVPVDLHMKPFHDLESDGRCDPG